VEVNVTGTTWQVLATAPNVPEARAMAALLEGQGIACQLRSDTELLGEARSCAILVDATFMHRAQQVIAETHFTDAELEFLATGMLCCDGAREKS
jgi:hypothetical protein